MKFYKDCITFSGGELEEFKLFQKGNPVGILNGPHSEEAYLIPRKSVIWVYENSANDYTIRIKAEHHQGTVDYGFKYKTEKDFKKEWDKLVAFYN